MSRKTLLMAVCAFTFLAGAAMAREYDPVANPKAVVVRKQARFTVLTPRVIRMEWSRDGTFEDHATLVFVNRRVPVPAYTVSEKDGWLRIETSNLHLAYRLDSGPFSADNLRIDFLMDGRWKTWKPGMPNRGNLHGTARTLDGYDGDRRIGSGKKIDLGQGLISRDGWVLIDDTERPIFDNSDWPWVQPRPKREQQDWYFFGYGYDYKQALKDFILIAGRIPMPPRFAFGIWWSRYWEYTDTEFRELVDEYATHQVPLDVLVVDIDWHIRFLPEWFKNGRLMRDQAGQSAGWTGYTWDRNYFPDPKDFLDWTEREGLKVCLNLHPAAGIQPHEAVYPEMARAMGIDPATKRYVPFDIVNKKFAENYMRLVLHPLQKMGVDFWWLDWQQWNTTSIPGVNPTFYLNYVFFSDMERRGKARPIIMHRYGGLGNHRYQIGFSGDTKISWKSLDFQPYFTVTAANVGFGYWSHDIGGHMRGDSPPELYTRWVQFGALSPIFRTHATKSPKIERRFWAYPVEYYYAMRKAVLLRHALIPYIYSQARKTYETGVSICHPLYYEHPKREEAYAFKNEYYFGDDLLVNPVTRPIGKDSLFVLQKVWLPPGTWYEWATGTLLDGDRTVTRAFTLDEIPLYARAGAILPMEPPLRQALDVKLDSLVLLVVPGDSGSTVLYEDEGNTDNYKRGVFAKTRITYQREGDRLKLVVEPAQGQFPGMVAEREVVVCFPLTPPPEQVIVDGQPVPHSRYDTRAHWTYNGSQFGVQVHTPRFDVRKGITVEVLLPSEAGYSLSGLRGKASRLMRFAKYLAGHPWDRSRFSNHLVVRTAQIGLILEQHPENADAELRQFPAAWEKVVGMIREATAGDPRYQPYLDLVEQCR